MTNPWRLAKYHDRFWASYACAFERDNPDPGPPVCKCTCSACRDCGSDYPFTLSCSKGGLYLVELPDGTYARACTPRAHGHKPVWVGEIVSHPIRARVHVYQLFDILKSLYPVSEIVDLSKTTSGV